MGFNRASYIRLHWIAAEKNREASLIAYSSLLSYLAVLMTLYRSLTMTVLALADLQYYYVNVSDMIHELFYFYISQLSSIAVYDSTPDLNILRGVI